MYARLRPWLFKLDAEKTHAATLRALQVAGATPPIANWLQRQYASVQSEPIEVFGVHFANRIGLAAGYDKDGLAWRGLACLDFGHVEIGTVTLRPQAGNPRPRIFRLVEEQSLINRLGFPSRGAEFVAGRLRGGCPEGLRIGVNLGINKGIAQEHIPQHYADLMELFNPLADYLTINVSSPNTPGLRQLEKSQPLAELLAALQAQREKPLLVKLSPDLEESERKATLDALLEAGIDGVIATNTTLELTGLTSPLQDEAGGLSGAALTERSRTVVARIHAHTGGHLPIIAAGGIMGAADARAMLEAGASLLQIYTGLVYRGPRLVRELLAATRSSPPAN